MTAVPRSGKFFKLLQSQLDEMKGNTPLCVLSVTLSVFCSVGLVRPKKESLDTWINKLGQFLHGMKFS